MIIRRIVNAVSIQQIDQNDSAQKRIDYSQYLKDANIDLSQSDLEDSPGKYRLFNVQPLISPQILIFFSKLVHLFS